MTALISALVLLSVSLTLTYLLGFRLGGESWQAEAARIRQEAADARREMHLLTRQAFTAIAEEVERRRERP